MGGLMDDSSETQPGAHRVPTPDEVDTWVSRTPSSAQGRHRRKWFPRRSVNIPADVVEAARKAPLPAQVPDQPDRVSTEISGSTGAEVDEEQSPSAPPEPPPSVSRLRPIDFAPGVLEGDVGGLVESRVETPKAHHQYRRRPRRPGESRSCCPPAWQSPESPKPPKSPRQRRTSSNPLASGSSRQE